jgi:ribosomal protein S18 acetylase RimI-like enzyme
MSIDIQRMQSDDIALIAPLLDSYRQFYEQTPDLARATQWLEFCYTQNKSIVFFAKLNSQVAGFAQLFPMLSTVRCANTWVLNDLFVAPFARKQGIGHALLDRVRDFAREDGAAYITLETMRSNLNAQALYHKAGWTAEQTQWFSVDFKEQA